MKKGADTMPKPPENHVRGALEGLWEPIRAPSDKKAAKKRGVTRNPLLHLGAFFLLF